MKTSFEIIKHSKITENGNTYEYFTVKKKFFGITYHAVALENIMDSEFNFFTSLILIIVNALFFIGILVQDFLFPLNWSIGIFIASIYLIYKFSKTKFNTLEDAEEYIKIHIRRKKFKSSTESVLKYNIDTNKGVFEKETTLKQLN